MNFEEIYKKIRAIEEGAPVAPVHTDSPASQEGIEIIGPMGGMLGGPMMHNEPPKQQDSVTMNVTMNGSGAGGIRDLMSVLKNIEQGGLGDIDPAQHDEPSHHDNDEEEPLIGDMMQAAAHHEEEEDLSPLSHSPDEEMEEVQNDDEQWANSAHGDVGAHTDGIDAVTTKGDDMNSKGGESPLARAPGTNSLIRHHYHVNEDLVEKLQSMYNAIKEERTEEKDEHGNVVRWKEESDWKKAEKKDGRGKVTNLSDKARRESEKMSKKDVKENAHHEDDEEKKIRHLMRKYGWSHQEALEYYHYEEHDPKDYEDMEESAKWRDPKYKGQLFTQKKGDSDDYDSIDYGYGIKERPKKDPGQKRSTFDRDTVWTDPLDTRSNLPKHHNDPENWGYGSISSKGDSKGKLTADRRKRMKNDIRGSFGQHHTPTLPEQMNESKELNAMLALNKRLNG